MCGVIGLVYERYRSDLGVIAAELLRTLEYRGYDSTGAAIQGETDEVDLRKDVGAPSVMAKALGIDALGGSVLCAQVRWATFGAVDRANAQPHVVRCHTYLYGAHNGNVTNCDSLKVWLQAEGHAVQSDNDGEMVVHTVEHFFAKRLAAVPPGESRAPAVRLPLMRDAIVEASARLKGSFAAVIVDPITRTAWAIKRGSSLYFGIGGGGAADRFAIASSDLSSVLKLTRAVVPMSEGDVAEFDAAGYSMFRAADGAPISRKPVRSKLRAEDTELRAPFTTFMAQEIHAQVETCRDVVSAFSTRSADVPGLGAAIDRLDEQSRVALVSAIERLREETGDGAIRAGLSTIAALPAASALLDNLPAPTRRAAEAEVGDLRSSERALFTELLGSASTPAERALVRVLDAYFERLDGAELGRAVSLFVDRVVAAIDAGKRVIIVCCGTSFHAAKTAALFFNEIAGVEVGAVLPGELRAQLSRCISDGDVLIAVSQSGETKDLIDVINQVINSGKKVTRVALVNNLNSTLAQEKAEIVLPLRCGPEVAVAATKSFINQLTMFYCLAIAVAERRSPSVEVAARRAGLEALPALIQRTLSETAGKIAEAAELLYLAPSVHILATRLVGIAKEGALKIREVVLNHTEGFEASEFKHGPNTILGVNTVFGLGQVMRLLDVVRASPDRTAAEVLAGEDAQRALYADYPLVYVTGPDARDLDLTISQINTHKIRGVSTIVIAEPDPALRVAAEKAPADNPSYRSVYVALPATGDTLLTVFSAVVALQTLALEMSTRKSRELDRLGFAGHGVHPDVPKNVSKSITVD